MSELPYDSIHEREGKLLNAALELATDDRAAFLDSACINNPTLRQRLENLLKAHDEAGTFLGKPAGGLKLALGADVPDQAPETSDLGEVLSDRIGRYKLLEKIGEGGCGVVYMAEQKEPVRRRVALKVIKLGMDTKQLTARFEAERQALALMDHPNIAKVLDAGATESGRPYFVMELVRGTRITDYCDENNLSTTNRLDLFIQVCKAIQHAHQKGIIHRDIKPSNILVTIIDGGPVPKVIDFGIAKATTGQQLTDKTLFTAFQLFIGTPAYMSPEQAVMTSVDIDTRSDIYSLGVLLYELLTGKTPFDAQELLKAGFDEMRRTIREEEPVRPSTRLSTMIVVELTTTAKRRQSDAPKLISLLRGDLDWIVMKCLEKDRMRRYETANGVARDIQRHLTNEPVTARPPSPLYEFQKTVRRHKPGFVAAGAVFTALLLGVMLSAWQAAQATRARNLARSAQASERVERNRAEENAGDALKTLIRQYVDTGNRLSAEGDLFAALPWYIKALEKETDPAAIARQRFRIGATLYAAPKLVQLGTHSGAINDVAFSADGRLVASASEDETVRLWDCQTGEAFGRLLPHTNAVSRVLFSADGTRLLSLAGGQARLWDPATGLAIAELEHEDAVTDAQFAPHTNCVLFACGKVIRVCDGRSGALLQRLVHPLPARAMCWSPDAKTILTGADDGRLRLWEVESGRTLFTNVLGLGRAIGFKYLVAFSPDGRTCGNVGTVGANLYDAATGKLTRTLIYRGSGWPGGNLSFSFSPDGYRLMVGTLEQKVLIWDIATGFQVGLIEAGEKHNAGPFSARFSPDGQALLTRTEEGVIRVWGAISGRPLCPPLRQAGSVTASTFAPDSRRLVTGGSDGVVKLWDLATQASLEACHLSESAASVEWSPDGRRIFTGTELMTGQLWEATTGQPVGSRLSHGPGITGRMGVSWSLDGHRLLTIGSGGFQVFEAEAMKGLTPWVQIETNKTIGAVLTPDGTSVIVTGDFPDLRNYSATTGQLTAATPSGHSGAVRGFALSRTGRLAFSWGQDGLVLLRNSANGAPVGLPLKHQAGVQLVVASHDEKRIASWCEDGAIHLWNIANRHEDLPPLRPGTVRSLEFSPDDRTLLTSGGQPAACLWDLVSGRPRVRLDHSVIVHAAAFDRTGSLVATSCGLGTRYWDAPTGEPLSPWLWREPAGEVWDVRFNPSDGRLMSVWNENNALTQVWNVQPDERSLELLRAQAMISSGESAGESPAQTLDAWAKLRANSRPQCTVPPEQALRWHRLMAEFAYTWPEPYPLAFHAARWLAAHPEDTTARWRLATGLLAQGRTSEAMAVEPRILPARPPEADPEQLDLTAFYNQRLEGSGEVSFDLDGMVTLQPGLRTLDGVRFDIRGVIHLLGAGELLTDSRAFPARTEPIPVHRRLARFHMLQFAYRETTAGTPIGCYVLRYADGQTRELPIRYAIDVRNWWLNVADAEAPLAELVWRGQAARAHYVSHEVGLFKRTYDNPRPDVEVADLEFRSLLSPSGPALVAITVE